MIHQVLHCGVCIAGHRATGILDELVVSVSGAGDSLWPGIGRRFRHTGQHRLGKGVHQREESLLIPATREMSRETRSNPPAIRSSVPVCCRRPFNSFWIAARTNALGLAWPRVFAASSTLCWSSRLRRTVILVLLAAPVRSCIKLPLHLLKAYQTHLGT